MKFFIIIFAILLFLSGCSRQNAFLKFNMSEEQELSISNLQSSKIKIGEEVNGIFSALYLNEVYPKKNTQNESFYIYVYLKDKKKRLDLNLLDDKSLTTLKLNGKMPIEIFELSNINQFSHLTSIQSEWNRYYMVTFKKEENKKLNLVFENYPFSSVELIYQKGE